MNRTTTSIKTHPHHLHPPQKSLSLFRFLFLQKKNSHLLMMKNKQTRQDRHQKYLESKVLKGHAFQVAAWRIHDIVFVEPVGLLRRGKGKTLI
jgi:hypothetical protein